MQSAPPTGGPPLENLAGAACAAAAVFAVCLAASLSIGLGVRPGACGGGCPGRNSTAACGAEPNCEWGCETLQAEGGAETYCGCGPGGGLRSAKCAAATGGAVAFGAAGAFALGYFGFHAALLSRAADVYFDPAETWENLRDRV